MAVNHSYKEGKVLKRTGKREETEQPAESAKRCGSLLMKYRDNTLSLVIKDLQSVCNAEDNTSTSTTRAGKLADSTSIPSCLRSAVCRLKNTWNGPLTGDLCHISVLSH